MTDLGNGTDARISDAALQARFHRERRNVNRDDFMPASLQIQGDPACSAAHVEHSAADLPHGSPLNRRPLLKWGKVRWSPCRKIEPAVVTFDHLCRS